MVVPTFASTFVNPSMSLSVSNPSIYTLQNDVTRDVADRFTEFALHLLLVPVFCLSQLRLLLTLWQASTLT